MALVVGTDAYIDLAYANTYWSDRNNAVWAAATDANKEKAIRESTQYIDGAYTFIGTITTIDQSLAFPRNAVTITSGNFKYRQVENDVIPAQIKQATAELALEALSARLEPVNDDVISKVKVDVIEVDYAEFAPSQKTFTFVSKILRGLTVGGEGQLNLVRV